VGPQASPGGVRPSDGPRHRVPDKEPGKRQALTRLIPPGRIITGAGCHRHKCSQGRSFNVATAADAGRHLDGMGLSCSSEGSGAIVSPRR
jgi:hypothetical protein